MEPVSLAFGVVGVASNIIDTSFKIRDPVAAYKSAAADIETVFNKIDRVVDICEILKSDRNLPNRHDGIRDRALAMCYSSVLTIHQELGGLTTKGKDRRQKLDWLLKKPAIERSLQGLGESILLLNAYLALGTSRCSSVETVITSPDTSGPPKAIALGEPPLRYRDETPFRHRENSLLRPKQKKRPIITKSETRIYKNALYLYSSAQICQRDDECTAGTENRSYRFGVPFLDTYIHLAMKRGQLSPWRLTLSTPRYIYEDQNKSLFDEILTNGPWRLHSVQSHEVARWLEEHGVSANTQLVSRRSKRFNGSQMSLLSAMVVYCRKNVVDCLLSREGQGLGDESHFSECMGFLRRSASSISPEGFLDDPAIVYVNMRGPLLTLEEYSDFVMFGDNPAYIELLLDSCRELLYEDEPRVLRYTACAVVLRVFLTPENRHSSLGVECSPLISKLIGLGLDVTQSLCPRHDFGTGRRQYQYFMPAAPEVSGTALHMVYLHGRRPIYETLNIAHEWVSCLEKASVPINQYLEAERVTEMERTGRDSTAQELDEWVRMSRTEKLELLHDLAKHDLRETQERRAPDDLIRTVMPSFQYMQTVPICAVSLEEGITHLAWKRNQTKVYARSWYYISWPFQNDTYTSLVEDRKLKNLDEGTLKMLSAYDYYISLYNSRAERRQSKKWEKLQKRIGNAQEESMPGAWKMEWWEYQGPW